MINQNTCETIKLGNDYGSKYTILIVNFQNIETKELTISDVQLNKPLVIEYTKYDGVIGFVYEFLYLEI